MINVGVREDTTLKALGIKRELRVDGIIFVTPSLK